ncbi:hypothetical protein ACX0GZ_05305 [Sphingomonas aestuarii]
MSEETISLYFGLKKGATADLEIISAAAIAWVETLRAAAQAIDPNSDVRVQLVNVDQSSAVYNVIADWFERNVEPKLDRLAKGRERNPRSRRMVVGLAAFTITTAYPTYDAYFGDAYTQEDRERDKRIEDKLNKSLALETAKQKFFRTMERERAITSVAIKERPDSDPIVSVESSEFPIAGGVFALEEEGVQERITQTVLDVVLVKPALVHTPRSWTFKPDGLAEFDAVMRDAKVLQAIQDRGFPAQMKEGVRMTIRIEAREVQVDGQWKLVRGGRSVMRVIAPKFD